VKQISIVKLFCVLIPFCASAQTSSYYEQTYLRAPYNFALRSRFPTIDALFNSFDYGHAILYETLWRDPDAPTTRLDQKEFGFITKRLLKNPPSVALDEEAIAPNWSRLAPEVLIMFDWAHMLHRQLYDIWSDDNIPPVAKDDRVRAALRYYRSRPALALSSEPKNMNLMEGQSYSLAFRKRFPLYNGLIWSYHWLQMALYDALMVPGEAARGAAVAETVRRFWVMLDGAGQTLPTTMPQSAAIAPCFSARYPEAAIIFDNLHSLHDVVSDILANPNVARSQKRATILAAAAQYRDSTTSITSESDWRHMAADMGVQRMGGVSAASATCTEPGH
jgi:hypothetical protein